MTSSAKVYYTDRILDSDAQEKLAYWNKSRLEQKRIIADLNRTCYSVLTIIPNVAWNRSSVAYFEDLDSAVKYRDRMIQKGYYCLVQNSK